MTLHVGIDNITDIRKGGTKIAKVYHGSDLVWGYPAGKVLFDSSYAGTYSINIKFRCKVSVIIVGGGSGGVYGWTEQVGNVKQGNSGALITGTTEVSAGTYQIKIGGGGNGASGHGVQTSGAGSESSFLGNIAGGGSSAVAFGSQGTGGKANVVSSGLVGSNGTAGSTTSMYGEYGGGGRASYLSYALAGQGGYVKIVAV